jgi:hypothetical protein
MKRTSLFFATIVFLLFVNSSFASEKEKESNTAASVKISGKIIDVKTGEALAGVMVKLEDVNVSSYSDLDGNFEINGLTPGKYNLSTSLISYETVELNVEAAQSSNKVKVELTSLDKRK